MDGGQQPDDPNAPWRRPTEDAPTGSALSGGVAVSGSAQTSTGFVGRAIVAVRSWWNGLEFVQMWHIVVVAAILATAGFGGLDTVSKTPTTFKPGEPFDNNQFLIVVRKATVLQEVVGDRRVLAKAKPGRVYLGVSADVTNKGQIPGSVSAMFSLPGLPDVQNADLAFRGRPSSFRVDDGTALQVLQPGLTEVAALVWSVPATAVHPGSQVEIRVPFRKYGAGYVIYGAGWRDANEYATVVVPVEAPR